MDNQRKFMYDKVYQRVKNNPKYIKLIKKRSAYAWSYDTKYAISH